MKNDPNRYEDSKRKRTLDLRADGVNCIPVLGMSNYLEMHSATDEHVHVGCVEICLCLRGRMSFISKGAEYPFLPGMVFVSQPNEPHCLKSNPKGLWLMRILFEFPEHGRKVLGLDLQESHYLVDRLRNFPVRLFPATERVNAAFEQTFTVYDNEEKGSVARQLKLKAAILELLLALIEAPYANPTPKGKPNAKVNRIVENMRLHPEAVYSTEGMAREAALSAAAFIDAFKRKTGLPPHAFLLDQRVKAAERDLADRKLTVATIANRYRFSSPQHFANVFKRINGHSPRYHKKGMTP